jgi:UPF0716 protein FxsA
VLVLFLVALLVVLPLTELYVIVQVGDAIGFGLTFLLLIGCSLVGLWIVKRQGVGTWRRAQAQLRAGEIPATEVVDGAVLLVAGGLLLVPGFVTDFLGALLLLPPVRWIPRRWAARHRYVRTGNVVYGRVIDVRGTATPRDPGDDPRAIEPPPDDRSEP